MDVTFNSSKLDLIDGSDGDVSDPVERTQRIYGLAGDGLVEPELQRVPLLAAPWYVRSGGADSRWVGNPKSTSAVHSS